MNLPIRVALVGLTPLVRDIVDNLIAGEMDMRVAGVIERGEADRAPGRDAVDVYVIGVGAEDAAASCEAVLGEAQPPRRVIGISSDGRQMHLSELRPATTALGALSSDELLEVIRGGRRRTEKTGPIDGTDGTPQ
jgi:hypothetical protein